MNPVKKQYLIIAVIAGFFVSFIVNFLFIELIRGTLLYGFPFNLNSAEGLGGIILRIMNFLISGGLFTIAFYYLFLNLQRR